MSGRIPGSAPNSCPCDSGRDYAACCGPWHAGAEAPDAEALMRSRYCAYALGLTDYLLQSWHPHTRPPTLTLDPDRRWLGLKIVGSERLGEDQASVTFIARSRVGGGRADRLHERSRFVRIDGRWLYVDGTML